MKMELICGDNVDVMSRMSDSIVDLTVTSPPYDKLRNYEGIDGWGDRAWKECIKQLYRITKPGGVVVWVVGDSTVKGSETGTSFKQALYAMEVGFRLNDTMIFVKANPVPISGLGHPRYTNAFEYMFVWSKGKPKTFNSIMVDRKNNRVPGKRTHRKPDGTLQEFLQSRVTTKKQRTNVWEYGVGGRKDLGHPAVFPYDLARDHVITWSNEGDFVLDPFVGSGTVGKVCKELNRDFLGIDISEKYIQISREIIG